MRYYFGVTKRTRKDFVRCLEEMTHTKTEYLYTPTYAFEVGDMTVNRDGSLTAPAGVVGASFLMALSEHGFELLNYEEEEADKEQETQKVKCTVAFPKGDANVENLRALIASKQALIQKALGCTNTEVVEDVDNLNFTWFDEMPERDVWQAHLALIERLYHQSKE